MGPIRTLALAIAGRASVVLEHPAAVEQEPGDDEDHVEALHEVAQHELVVH